MSIFKKIMTAVRGGATEVGEAIVDANSTRIFEQEIRDAENHLTKAKRDLTGVMAQQMAASREVDRIKREIVEHEGYATQALEQGNEALALEVAEKIASLEGELATNQQSLESFDANATRLKELVTEYKRQLSMVKTTESVQKATSAITDNFSSSNSKLLNAKDSLERIKAKQQKFDDQLKAAEVLESENSDNSLEAKLKAAGIGSQDNSANSVLDRLKAKQK